MSGNSRSKTFSWKCCIFMYQSIVIPINNLTRRLGRIVAEESVGPVWETSRKAHNTRGGIVGDIAVTRNLEPTALFIGLSAGNGGGRQPGRIVQTRKRSEAEQAGRWMLVLVGACDSSSRERAAPPDTIAEHLRSDPRWLTQEGPTTSSNPPPTHSFAQLATLRETVPRKDLLRSSLPSCLAPFHARALRFLPSSSISLRDGLESPYPEACTAAKGTTRHRSRASARGGDRQRRRVLSTSLEKEI